MGQQPLAQQIRAKYPGDYDDLSDADLESKWRAKHGDVSPVEPPPHVSEFQRLKAGADAQQAINDEHDRNWPADVASKLPAPLQKPVAMALSLVKPAGEIAAVASSAPALLETAGALRQTLSEPADAILNAFMRKFGGDPESLELAAAKMKLQAARSRTRQAVMTGKMGAKSAPEAAQPVEAAPAMAPPSAAPAPAVAPPPAPMAAEPPAPSVAPPAAAARAGDTVALPAAQRTPGQLSASWLTNDVSIAAKRLGLKLTLPEAQGLAKQVAATGRSPLEVVQGFSPAAAVEKLRLTADETALALRMAKQGAKPTDIQAAITALRQSPMGRMPSTQAVQAAVADRNATGRWK